MINAEAWSDAEEWPSPKSEAGRERIRDIIEFLEHQGPIKRASARRVKLSEKLMENPNIRRAMHRRILLDAERNNGLN